jgi:hypothetical protein
MQLQTHGWRAESHGWLVLVELWPCSSCMFLYCFRMNIQYHDIPIIDLVCMPTLPPWRKTRWFPSNCGLWFGTIGFPTGIGTIGVIKSSVITLLFRWHRWLHGSYIVGCIPINTTISFPPVSQSWLGYLTFLLFNIAMENCPFIDDKSWWLTDWTWWCSIAMSQKPEGTSHETKWNNKSTLNHIFWHESP